MALSHGARGDATAFSLSFRSVPEMAAAAPAAPALEPELGNALTEEMKTLISLATVEAAN